MKKNENKVANLIGNKVAQQLEGIKDATSKSKTTKAQGTKKTKAQLVEESQEAAKKLLDFTFQGRYPISEYLPHCINLLKV